MSTLVAPWSFSLGPLNSMVVGLSGASCWTSGGYGLWSWIYIRVDWGAACLRGDWMQHTLGKPECSLPLTLWWIRNWSFMLKKAFSKRLTMQNRPPHSWGQNPRDVSLFKTVSLLFRAFLLRAVFRLETRILSARNLAWELVFNPFLTGVSNRTASPIGPKRHIL